MTEPSNPGFTRNELGILQALLALTSVVTKLVANVDDGELRQAAEQDLKAVNEACDVLIQRNVFGREDG